MVLRTSDWTRLAYDLAARYGLTPIQAARHVAPVVQIKLRPDKPVETTTVAVPVKLDPTGDQPDGLHGLTEGGRV